MPTSPLFDNLLGETTPKARAEVRGRLEECSCGLASVGGPAHVYNEEAFRYFLEVERKRSEVSNRPFLLLLVDVKKHVDIDAPPADRLLEALSARLRETDFIGWYRTGSIAGVVLTQHSHSAADVQEAVRRRITQALRDGVPPELASRLQVRVYQVPPTVQGLS